jgi:hypothetical protein
MGYFGLHPGANPRELRRYAELGELGYVQWAKAQAFQFVREYPREFLDLTLHRVFWFWDGTPLMYQAEEWWKPWEFWPLSAAAWLGLIFLVTRRARGWLLYAACLVVYPLPYYFVYPVAKYRYAIEPEMVVLSVFLAAVLWSELRGKQAGSSDFKDVYPSADHPTRLDNSGVASSKPSSHASCKS